MQIRSILLPYPFWRLYPMTIGGKFNTILSFLFILLLGINAGDDYVRQKNLVIRTAVDHSRVLARQIIETRNYMSSVIRGESATNPGLIPQVVATSVAERISKETSFSVRQISARYRNPANRPNEYESEALARLVKSGQKELYEVTQQNGQSFFRYLLPMVAEASCLECHGTYDTAPSYVQSRFPKGHTSYGYRQGELIGAVSITIPMSELYRLIGTNLQSDLLAVGFLFLLVIILLWWITRRTLLLPITQLSDALARITASGDFSERLPTGRNDAIGRLFENFNAMQDELAARSHQSKEATERFQNLTEMARSAIITFLENGQIVSMNPKGEILLGVDRREILGSSIYQFFIEGESLKEGISSYAKTGTGGGVGETLCYQVIPRSGSVISIEAALSATRTEGHLLFTIILRSG